MSSEVVLEEKKKLVLGAADKRRNELTKKGNKKENKRPRWILFYDSETKWTDEIQEIRGEMVKFRKNTLKLGHFTLLNVKTGKTTHYKIRNDANIVNALKGIFKRVGSERLYLMAHNINFDNIIFKLQTHLEDFGFEKSMNTYDENMLYIAKYKYNPDIDKKGYGGCGEVMMINTANFFPQSLKKMGEVVGSEKMEVDFNSATDEELAIYCKQDVNVMVKFLQTYLSILDEEDLDFKHTISSQAYHAYFRHFNSIELEPERYRNGMDIKHLDRQAYFGGRTEVFWWGAYKDVYCYDINSMYAKVMRDELYPTRLIDYFIDVPKSLQWTLMEQILLSDNRCYVASVVCEIPTNSNKKCFIPTKENGTTLFRRGKDIVTTLTTPELKKAIREGYVKKLLDIRIYEGERIFENFVTHFYTKRLELQAKKSSLEKMYKLILASLYGKFGQLNDKKINITKANFDRVISEECRAIITYEELVDRCREQDKLVAYRDEYGKEWLIYWDIELECLAKIYTDDESVTNFPAIASHVTAYARMLLYTYMEYAEESLGKRVLYCDTDSLFVEGEITEPDFNSVELGLLKREKRYTSAEFRGLKLYWGSKFDEDLKEDDEKEPIRKVRPEEVDEFLVGCKEYLVKTGNMTCRGVSNGAALLSFDLDEGKASFRNWMWGGETTQKSYDKLGRKDGEYWMREKTIDIDISMQKYKKGLVYKNGTVVPFSDIPERQLSRITKFGDLRIPNSPINI